VRKTASYCLGLALLLTLSPLTSSYAQKAGTKKAAPASSSLGNVEGITAAQLKDYLYFVASDEMEGRDTPSRGLDLTAKFLAMNLSRAGVRPGGDDGTYFQRIKLVRNKIDPEKSRAELNGTALTFGEDYIPQTNPGSASGSLVYVGSGWVVPGKNINAYQGVDVRDKIAVLIQTGLPKGMSFNDLMSGKEGVDWIQPLSYLTKNGAKGVIIVAGHNFIANWAQRRQTAVERGSPWAVEKFQKSDAPPLPTLIISEKTAVALFQGEKVDGLTINKNANSNEPGAAFDLAPTKQVKFNVSVKSEETNTQNVVGVLEGADPTLKKEYISIGAHYDHVGIGNAVNGDAIFNGADDDGSGTVAVLAIAEAFAKGPRPKRSIMFVWHAGEEKGLWGSKYITDFPLIPINQIVAQLNIDMIGRSKRDGDTDPRNKELSGPNEIYVIGSKMMSTELGELSERVNKSLLNLSFNYRYDDPKDPNRFFYRSDHYNYAKKGIPIIFYFDGVHEDYHRPGDHPDKIDYEKMEKVGRTIFATAWELSNRPTRPRIDKQLPVELLGN
jgi:Zn-dependent M28 family amino/carboxypeptidase